VREGGWLRPTWWIIRRERVSSETRGMWFDNNLVRV